MKALLNWCRALVAAWNADSERISEYCRQEARQRDAERAEYQIWRGIVQ